MASPRTRLSELGTAAGLVYDARGSWPDAIEQLTIPGIPDKKWKPVVVPATATSAPDRELLLAALANGRAFRRAVLGGRRPTRVEWLGGAKAVWSSDIPRDLTVDRVFFIQAKYDSTCVLNTSPWAVFDALLGEADTAGHRSWFEEVAPLELQAYYRRVSDSASIAGLPPEVIELDAATKLELKAWMRSRDGAPDAETEAYRELCGAVASRTADRWLARLHSANPSQQTRMLFRILRIAGGPYWLLGTKGRAPVRLAVMDTRSWRERFELKRFGAEPAEVGQPQVDWWAEIAERSTRRTTRVDGYCEIRWSHGKLQGSPECKIQVTTPLDRAPGYEPMVE